jgi:hypothetical protein
MAKTDISDLLDALKFNMGKNAALNTNESDFYPNVSEPKEDIVQSFVDNPVDAAIRQAALNIDKINNIIEEARKIVEQSGDPVAIDSFSNVAKAAIENIKILSLASTEKAKLVQEKELALKQLEFKEKDLAQKKELKLLEIASKEKIAEGKRVEQPKAIGNTNNYLFLANRDALFNSLYETDETKRKKVIDEIMENNGFVQEAELVEASEIK